MNQILTIPRSVQKFGALLAIFSLLATSLPIGALTVEAARTGLTVTPSISSGEVNETVFFQASITDDGAATGTVKLIFDDGSAGGTFTNASGTTCTDDLVTPELTVASGTSNKGFCYKNSTPGDYTLTINAEVDSISIDTQVATAQISAPTPPPPPSYSFPSTNDNNATNNYPHVVLDSSNPGSVTLHFVNETNSRAQFEYRIDGVASDQFPSYFQEFIGDTHPIVGGEVYPQITLDNRTSASSNLIGTTTTETFSAASTVEVRLALGGERDWDFDWVTFNIPEPKDEETIVVTGNTAAGENQPGWLFNRDLRTSTPFMFTNTQNSIGNGSLYVFPITNTNTSGLAPNDNWDKFIAEYFALTQMGDINSFSYDFNIGGGGAASSANHFYLNVYANYGSSSPTKYYDCRYDVLPASGSVGSWSTVTFNPNQTYSVTPNTCPSSPADMGADAVVRAFAINLGDTSANDTGIDGYFDNVVFETATKIITYDFEPLPFVSEIISPEANEVVDGVIELKAIYADENGDGDDGLNWAVYAGNSCAHQSGNRVAGNAEGTLSNWDGENFTADFDTTSVANGEYCFVFNPIEDTGNTDQRLTQLFTIQNNPPTAEFTATPSGDEVSSGGYTSEEHFTFNLEFAGEVERYQLKYWNDIATSSFKEATPWNLTNLAPYSSSLGVYNDKFTQGEGTHYFSFSACHPAGHCSEYSEPFVVTYDGTVPDAVDGLTVAFDGGTPMQCSEGGDRIYTNNRKITISWNASESDDISHYFFGTKFNQKHRNVGLNTFYNGNMTPGNNPYYYSVIAVDAAGNESEISRTCEVILDQEAPSTPNPIFPNDGQVLSDTELYIDWSESTDDATDQSDIVYEYRLYLENPDTNPDAAIRYSKDYTGTTRHPASGFASGTPEDTYFWRVRACDESGLCSDWSEVQQFTVDNSEENGGGSEPSFTFGTTTVTSSSMQGWAFNSDRDTWTMGPTGFVTGPATAPLNVGSAMIGTNTDSDRTKLGLYINAGIPMGNITELTYSTYRTATSSGPETAPALQFDIEFTHLSSPEVGRIVYEPYFNGTVQNDVWQTWNAIAGKWWIAGVSGLTNCTQGHATSCTWAELLTYYPDMKTSSTSLENIATQGEVLFKAGGSWGDFTGYVDNFVLGIKTGDDTHTETYDFEPEEATPETPAFTPAGGGGGGGGGGNNDDDEDPEGRAAGASTDQSNAYELLERIKNRLRELLVGQYVAPVGYTPSTGVGGPDGSVLGESTSLAQADTSEEDTDVSEEETDSILRDEEEDEETEETTAPWWSQFLWIFVALWLLATIGGYWRKSIANDVRLLVAAQAGFGVVALLLLGAYLFFGLAAALWPALIVIAGSAIVYYLNK